MHLPFGGENRNLGWNSLPGGFVSPSGLDPEKVSSTVLVGFFPCSGKSRWSQEWVLSRSLRLWQRLWFAAPLRAQRSLGLRDSWWLLLG